MKPRCRPWILSFALSAVLIVPAWAATRTVYPDGSGAYPTIQSAISASVNGDVVELADGTFSGDGNRDVSFLGKAVTVRSQHGAAACTLDIGTDFPGSHRGFLFENGEGPDAYLAAGWHVTSWDGRDLSGRPVPAGVYYCLLEAGSLSTARTTVLRR